MPKWSQHPVTAMPAREQRAASEAVGTPGGGQRGAGEGAGAPGRRSSCVAGRGYTLWLRSPRPFPLVIFSGLRITGTTYCVAWRHPTPSRQQVLWTETKGSFRSARLLGLRCPAWQVFSTLQTIDHYTETKSSHFSPFFTFVLLHKIKKIHIRSVQLLSCVRLFATLWTAARQASLSITNSWSLLKLMFIHWVMPSNNLILCRTPTPFNLSQHQGLLQCVIFSYQVAKVLELQLQHQFFQ